MVLFRAGCGELYSVTRVLRLNRGESAMQKNVLKTFQFVLSRIYKDHFRPNFVGEANYGDVTACVI